MFNDEVVNQRTAKHIPSSIINPTKKERTFPKPSHDIVAEVFQEKVLKVNVFTEHVLDLGWRY